MTITTKQKVRNAVSQDGLQVWKLACDVGTLDLNSPYSYLLLCKFFSKTCLVSEDNGRIIGFVTAFSQPERGDSLFIWQVAVHPSYRGQGIAKTLIYTLLKHNKSQHAAFLEATVTPTNKASDALFRSIAKTISADCKVSICFPADSFPGSSHEPEYLYRIGPIRAIR